MTASGNCASTVKTTAPTPTIARGRLTSARGSVDQFFGMTSAISAAYEANPRLLVSVAKSLMRAAPAHGLATKTFAISLLNQAYVKMRWNSLALSVDQPAQPRLP